MKKKDSMQSYKSVKPGPFIKDIVVPTSKSYANRLLLIAAISPAPIEVTNLPGSTDVLTMIDCLEFIGLLITKRGESIIIKNSFPECEKEGSSTIVLETGDGGTTTRFLTALVARGKRKYSISPDGHMRNRPMRPLIDALKMLNVAVIEDENCWLSVKGPFSQQAEAFVDCLESTQFITGLRLATIGLDIVLKPLNLINSKKYYELTEMLIREYEEGTLSYCNPVDSSSLSYPLALAALAGRVCVKNCQVVDPYQADSIIVSILQKMGAIISQTKKGLVCEKKELTSIEVDGSTCPDIIPTIAFLASYAKGESVLKNLGTLRHKESDRLEQIINIFDRFEVSYTLKKDDLFIKGSSPRITHRCIDVAADHRMVMVASLFLKINDGGEINNAIHVKKSYPRFFEDIE